MKLFRKKTRQKDEKRKSLFMDILELVVLFIIAFLAFQLVATMLGTSSPMFSVVSESMEPTLHVGDMVIIQKSDTYNVGDIVVYMYGSKPIIHRIIEIKNGDYIIKGDNNPASDPYPVKKSQIVGKSIAVLPLAGFPRLLLYNFGI